MNEDIIRSSDYSELISSISMVDCFSYNQRMRKCLRETHNELHILTITVDDYPRLCSIHHFQS